MKTGRTPFVKFAVVTLFVALLAVGFGVAQTAPDAPTPITIAQLKGTWTAALSGVTGCGVSTLTVTFTLDSTGNGTQLNTIGHTAACGDSVTSGQPVQIQSFNPDGSGFIAFGCGAGCGFGFNMQVNKAKQVFNLGPQSVPGNYLAGTAVKKNL